MTAKLSSRSSLFFLAALVIAALALSACGGAATPAVTSAPPATDVPVVTEAPTTAPAATAAPAVTAAPTDVPPTAAPAATVEPTAPSPTTSVGCTVAGFDPAAMIMAGEAVFANTCADCHGPQGQGQGEYPSLIGDDLTKPPAEVAREFLNPKYHPFLANLTPDQIASVLTYARQAFGNNASVICPEDLSGLLP
jgi:mono/diheme cytochrome c family protein